MHEDLAEFSLAYLKKAGVEYAEARLEEHQTNRFILKNSRLEAGGSNHYYGLGLRYILHKTMGFISANDFGKDDKEKIKQLMEQSLKLTAKSSKIKEAINFSPAQAVKEDYQTLQKIKIQDFPTEEKIKLIAEIDKSVLAAKVKVPNRYFSLSDDLLYKFYLNSEGTKITAKIPRVVLMYYLTLVENNQPVQRYWEYGSSCGYESFGRWQLDKKLPEEIKALAKNVKLGIKPPQQADVVVAPEVTGIMVHESAGHPYEADRIFGREAAQAGESFINQKMLGKKIGQECITVADDPTLPGSYGYFLYDDEGVKARRKLLVKNGLINEFLHNRETAARLSLASNGSARANNYDKEAMVRMSNTFLMPGNYTEEELFEDIKLGVYIKNFMEWNIDDKRLNQKYVGNEAYLIKNGRLTDQPVKKPAIEITTPKLWSSADAVANNSEYHAGNCGKGEPMQAIPVWFGGPSFRIRNLRLS
ncbi:TldD/PmbA family protein [Candidatus Woesearchaeota archaeon]|nr:TldD/PmbA family protein [Candidatus Woesearchaeota archaeon]